MPIEIAVMLEEGAKALAANFGKQLAKDFANYFFGHFASKDDILRAIEELKTFIDQRMDQLEDDLEAAGLLAAQTHLNDYRTTGDLALLNSANDKLVESISLYRTRSAKDPSFDRTHFVNLLKLVSADITIWIYRSTRDAVTEQEIEAALHNKEVLRDRCTNHAKWLDNTINAIEQHELESLTDISIQAYDASAPYDPPGPPPPRITDYTATFDVLGAKYPGGRRTVSASTINDFSAAKQRIEQARIKESNRIVESTSKRNDNLISPARDYAGSLRAIASALP